LLAGRFDPAPPLNRCFVGRRHGAGGVEQLAERREPLIGRPRSVYRDLPEYAAIKSISVNHCDCASWIERVVLVENTL